MSRPFPMQPSAILRPRPATGAFTFMEMMISVAASVIVIGALLVSAISLRRALNSSKVYADAYSDQRRVTDYIGRDLRRAVAVAMTDAAGIRTEVTGDAATVLIADRATLIRWPLLI